ncbi:MAG: hypothetical protein RL499_1146 [Actinomycetota bacterium]
MLVALAIPGMNADAIELAVLRAGHRVAWRASDHDEILTQLAQRAPDVVLLADHPAVATATVIGSCDLLGVRSCLVIAADVNLSVGAQRLGLHDVLRFDADGSLNLAMLAHDDAVTSAVPPMPASPPAESDASATPLGTGEPATASRAAAVVDPPRAQPAFPPSVSSSAAPSGAPRVIAVWGPAGAPGRTTVAIGLAAEFAARGFAVCLADADTYGGTVAPALGLLDESPGFAAACRLAGAETLTHSELDRVSQSAPAAGGATFAVLTGIGRPHRWPELSSSRVTAVLEQCRRWRTVTIIDAGFSLETDEEISSDVAAPRRNAATIAALRAADDVVAVGAADPLGLARLLRTHADLLETVDGARVRIVANRVRASVLGIDPHGQVRQTLDRFGGIRDAVLIDDDRDAADAALLTARAVPLAAPRSYMCRGIVFIAVSVWFVV